MLCYTVWKTNKCYQKMIVLIIIHVFYVLSPLTVIKGLNTFKRITFAVSTLISDTVTAPDHDETPLKENMGTTEH